MKYFTLIALIALAGCGGGGSTPPVMATPSPAPLVANPAQVVVAVGNRTTFSVYGGVGGYFLVGLNCANPSVLEVTEAMNQSPFYVTGRAAGTCTVVVSDNGGTRVSVPVTVTQ